jgi:hypothetical protein
MTGHHRHDHTDGCHGHDDHTYIDDPPPRRQPGWGWLMARLGGHSHAHGHTTTDDIESSREGLRALWISLGALGVTALAQAAVVAVSGSVALLADTIHNVTDALTADVVVVGASVVVVGASVVVVVGSGCAGATDAANRGRPPRASPNGGERSPRPAHRHGGSVARFGSSGIGQTVRCRRP